MGTFRRFAASALVASGLLLAFAAPAHAHGDELLLDRVIELAPEEILAVAGEVHYHRLVGRFSASAPVVVRLRGPDGAVVVERGPDTQIRLNELLRCCEAPWSPHELEIENVGAGPTNLDVSARFVHDDLAVMVDGAESGTRVAIGLLGGLWVLLLRRARRRGATTAPGLGRIATPGTLVVAVVTGVALLGGVRYGVGGAPGLVAGGADLPLLPWNPVVSRASLLVALAMVGFGLVGTRWAAAAAGAPRRLYIAAGIVIAAAPIAVAVAVAAAYGDPWIPATMAAVASVPVLALLAIPDRPPDRGVTVPKRRRTRQLARNA